MSSYGKSSANVNKTIVLETVDSNPDGIFTGCTAIVTNMLQSCTGNTYITMGTDLISTTDPVQVNSLSATTIFSGGTNLIDIINDGDTYLSGSTLSGSTLILTRNDGFNVIQDLSSVNSGDTFVTEANYSSSADTITLTRNDNVDIEITGVTDTFVTGGTLTGSAILVLDRNDSLSAITVDLSPLLDDTNSFVTGSTFNNDTLTLTLNNGDTVETVINEFNNLTVSGNTSIGGILTASTVDANTILSGGTNILDIVNASDTFVTGGTLSDKTLVLDRNDSLSAITVDLSGLTTDADNGLTLTSGGTIELGGTLKNNRTYILNENTNFKIVRWGDAYGDGTFNNIGRIDEVTSVGKMHLNATSPTSSAKFQYKGSTFSNVLYAKQAGNVDMDFNPSSTFSGITYSQTDGPGNYLRTIYLTDDDGTGSTTYSQGTVNHQLSVVDGNNYSGSLTVGAGLTQIFSQDVNGLASYSFSPNLMLLANKDFAGIIANNNTVQLQSDFNNYLWLNDLSTNDNILRDATTNKRGLRYVNFGEVDVSGTSANYDTLVGTSLVPLKLLEDKIAAVTLTSGNGITVSTGNTINLGGLLSEPFTVLSGGTTALLDLGGNTAGANLSQGRINATSFQTNNLTAYDGSGVGTAVNSNPGGFSITNNLSNNVGTATFGGTITLNSVDSVANRTSQLAIEEDFVQLNATNTSTGEVVVWEQTYNSFDLYAVNSGATELFRLKFDRANSKASFTDSRSTTKGIEYAADYSSGYTDNSLIVKRDLDTAISSVTGDTYTTGFTYDNNNNFTVSLNDGTDLTANISQVSGLTVNGDVLVNGNVDIIGSATTINSEQVLIKDNIITLNSNVTGSTTPILNSGFEVLRGSGDTKQFLWDESTDEWTLDDNTKVDGTITSDRVYTDIIDFNTGYTGNTIVEGRMYWSEDDQTVALGLHSGEVQLQLGQETHYLIKNQSGTTIENGRVVRAAGTLGSSGRILGEYMIADGTIPPKFTLGVATHDIINGEDGYVTEFGLVRGIDTTGSLYGETWNDGDLLWVSPTIPGGLTNIEPVVPNLHIEVAIVINAAANGSIFVRPHRYPYAHDLQDFGWSGGTESDLDVVQWDSSLKYFKLTNTPNFNSLSATTISGTTYYGDGSNLTGIDTSNIYNTDGTIGSGRVATLTDTLTLKAADQTTATNLNIVDSLNNNLLNVNNQGKLTVNLQGTGGLNYAFEVNTTDGVVFQADRNASITWWRNGTPNLRLLQDVYQYYNNAGTKLLNTVQYDASVHPFGGEGLEYTPLNAQMRINGDVSLNNINVFEELQIRGTYLGIGKGTLSQLACEKISLQDDTLINGELVTHAPTTPVLDACHINDSYSFYIDGGELKGRYKNNLGVVTDLTIGGYATDVIGIADTNGVYTFYSDYASAIAAASAGDTIEQFGDIVETGAVSLTIDKNLTIQMNGYSYTLDNTGTTDCVYLSSSTLTDVKILNGTINRINGTGGRCLYTINNTTTKPKLTLDGTTLYTDLNATGSLMWVTSDFTVTGGLYTGAGNILMDTDSTLTNFTYNGSGYVGAWRTRVMISNGYIYTTNSTYGLFVSNSAEASNVTVKVNGTGRAIQSTGKVSNCEGYSSGGIGIYQYGTNDLDGLFNSYGYSDSSYGIYVGGRAQNCVGRSVGSNGMFLDLRNNPEVINCVAWSSVAAGMHLHSSGTSGRIVNCFAQSELDTTSGHAFSMANGTCRFINCTGKVANAGAYGISSTSSANAYITNFTGEGMTTLFNGVTNLQVTTQDAYGNKLIG